MGLPLLALLAALSAGRPPAPLSPVPASSTDATGDERVFRDAHLDPGGPSVLEFFRDRTHPPSAEQIATLVRQLSAKDPAVCDRAAGALVRAGTTAVSHLRPAANAMEDAVAASRARRCLELIEGRAGASLVSAAARLAAAGQPAGTAEVLLAYLPLADDADVSQEVERALTAVCRVDGRPNPALLAALADASPVRRAAAATVLCHGGSMEALAAVRGNLKDASAAVRLRTALGLAERNDAGAVEVLIDLLSDQSPERSKTAERFLTRLAGEWAIATPQGNDDTAIRLRREMWLTWWRNVDGSALLAEFRSRTLTDTELEHARELMSQLDGESAEIRDKAAAELVALGSRIVPLLRRAESGTGRVAGLGAGFLEEIEGNYPRPLPAAAGRLLTVRRPAGALQAILAYLPCAESEEAEAALTDLLPDLGVRDGKADPLLVAALEDKSAARRAAAAVALCKGAAIDELPAVRKLLHDPDVDVRLRSGLALVGARDKEALSTLIDLLADHPRPEKAAAVEELLLRIAGDQAPVVLIGNSTSSRRKARDAWIAWWQAAGATIDLGRVELVPHQLGHLLVLEMWTAGRGSGQVAEVDRDGKVRWQVSNLAGPQDAQLLPRDRILIAEQNANRVTERDLTGKILWERSLVMAFQCQRLRNGNTFMAGRNQLIEVDRAGKEIFSLRRPDYLVSARRFRDGQTAFITNQGNYVRLDAAGKQVKSFHLPLPRNTNLVAAEVLPADRIVISAQYQDRVMEYDAGGKAVWEASVSMPGNPTRLVNGHTLVVSGNSTRVTELNQAGKVIAEWKDLPVHPWRVNRR